MFRHNSPVKSEEKQQSQVETKSTKYQMITPQDCQGPKKQEKNKLSQIRKDYGDISIKCNVVFLVEWNNGVENKN